MNNVIFTPTTLWQNFDDTLPLKDVTIKTVNIKNAELNYVYFSGRQTDTARVRIYGIFAKQKMPTQASILILPDCRDSIDPEIILHYYNLGYNVLSVDIRGEYENVKDFTKYPLDVDYANFLKVNRTFYYADNTAKQTCWYEWASVARYAVTYLKNKIQDAKIGVIGIKNSANVLWQLSAMDKRVDCSVFLFGAGWLAYKNFYKLEGSVLETNDERMRFLAGVDAQAYAQFVECPTLFLTTTNNEEFDSDRALDTLSRIKNQEDCYFNFSTNCKDVLDFHALKNVSIFFEKYLLGNKISLGHAEIDGEIDGEDFILNVYGDNFNDISSIFVFLSYDDISPKDRVWYNVTNYTKNKDNSYTFKQRIFGDCKTIIAFSIVKYNNGFTTSTKYLYKNVNLKTHSNLPSVLFNSTKYLSNVIVEDIDEEFIGNVFSTKRLYELKEGPNGILGVSTCYALSFYNVRKMAGRLKDESFLKIDVYSKNANTITFTIKNSKKEEFLYKINIQGGENWVNLQLPLEDFMSSNKISLEEFSDINSIKISSLGEFMINNFLLI